MQTYRWRDDFYFLDDGRVRQFLILGDQEALLIDTGFEESHVIDAVRAVTDLPVKVLMTHGDPDHTGGLKNFKSCYMREKDWHLVQADVELHPLEEGELFPCGDYCLEVIEIPGHTYGSVAFLDRKNRLLLSGDSVQKEGPIYLFGGHRNLDLYIESQKKLLALGEQVEEVLPCHQACPIGPEYIGRNLEDAVALRAGRLEGKQHPFLPCCSYRGKWTEFYY